MFYLGKYIASKVLLTKPTEEEKTESIDLFSEILEKKDVHLLDKKTAHLLINDNSVVSLNDVPGLTVDVTQLYKGVKIIVKIAAGTKMEKPIHLCVGKLSTSKEPLQQIFVELTVGDDCDVSVLAHCIFQSAKVRHMMEGTIRVGKNSLFKYIEGHIHPKKGDVVVKPYVKVYLEKDSKFVSDFQLIEGIAGKMDVRYDCECKEGAVADLTVRIASKGDDVVRIYEDCYLNEKNSRAILKTRVSARGNADCEVRNVLIAKAENCVGHVDCHEVLKDNGSVTAIPMIKAINPLAKVTHEASLGRVNEKQLETLLSKGLSEDEATELIIKGMLEM